MVCLTATIDLHAAVGVRAKRVLMISTGSRFSVGFPIVEQNALESSGSFIRATWRFTPNISISLGFRAKAIIGFSATTCATNTRTIFRIWSYLFTSVTWALQKNFLSKYFQGLRQLPLA